MFCYPNFYPFLNMKSKATSAVGLTSRSVLSVLTQLFSSSKILQDRPGFHLCVYLLLRMYSADGDKRDNEPFFLYGSSLSRAINSKFFQSELVDLTNCSIMFNMCLTAEQYLLIKFPNNQITMEMQFYTAAAVCTESGKFRIYRLN